MRRTRSKESGSKAARAHSQDDEHHSHDDGEDAHHGHGHAHAAHPQPTAEVHIADPPVVKKRGAAGEEVKEKVTRRKSDGHEHDAAHPSLAQHFHPPEHHEEHPQHTHAHEIIFDPCSFLPAVPAAGEKPLVLLDGNTLTLETLLRLSTGKFSLDLTFEAWARVSAAREMVDKIVAEKRVVYGINTGFGNFANVVIPPEKVNDLQVNLIRSHAAGVGHYLPLYQTRMLLALRANVLAKGHSGVKPSTLKTLLTAFNKDCLSAVPEKGTVGASGDLAPLSHLALGLLGEGLMWNPLSRHYEPAGNVLKANDIKPIHLEAKEGLALINGTQFIASLGAEAVLRAERLAKTADVVATLTLEALKGTRKAFFEEIHAVRAHPGQVATAARIRALLNYEKYPSAIADSHKNCGTVQDSYTLRCIPQVHGMTHDTIAWVKSVLTTEINSATDNPMIFAEKGLLISGGNFHGEYPAKAMDYLAIGIHEIANMSERRTERLVNHALSGLPAFLVEAGGLNSGFMIAHCTAAALTSENKVLVHPASSDTISTSAAKEDHVSMGGYAARKAIEVVSNVEKVVAIELMAACQGIDLHRPLKTTEPLEKVWQLVRQTVRMWDGDRFIKPDIDACTGLVSSGAIWEAARPYIESQQK